MKPLAEVYKVANEFDFPVIRGFCKKEYEKLSRYEQLLYRDNIGDEECKVTNKFRLVIKLFQGYQILQMSQSQVQDYLNNCNRTSYTQEEMLAIARFGKITVNQRTDNIKQAKRCMSCDGILDIHDTSDKCTSCMEVYESLYFSL